MKKTLWLLPIALLLAGCGLFSLDGSVLSPADATATQAAADTPAHTPTPEATPLPPTPTEAPAVLPAPAYFINSADGQIWRVERDGETTTRITSEAGPVEYFDVSPVDGALVYVSGNALIRADSLGQGRTVLVAGPSLPPDDYEARITRGVMDPVWSPLGDQIAFNQNGVNLIPANGGEVLTLIPNTPYPDFTDPNVHDARFYRPIAWSPDATRLLIGVAYFPEGGEFAILLLNSDADLVTLHSSESTVFGQFSWSPDGQSVYISNELIGLFDAGLWRADAATGQVETLITGYNDRSGRPPTEADVYRYAAYARQLGDGQLYAFLGSEAAPEVFGAPPSLSMVRLNPADVSQQTSLRPDSHVLREALWAGDASGALIVDASQQPSDQWSASGPLVWLGTDGSPAVTLPAEGNTLRWGS